MPDLVEQIVDTVILINKGQVLAFDSLDKIQHMLKATQIKVNFLDPIDELTLKKIENLNEVQNLLQDNHSLLLSYDGSKNSAAAILDSLVKDFNLKREKIERIEGQTDDALRTAGLKIVSRGLLKELPKIGIDHDVQPNWDKLRVFTNEPRHLLRSTPPRSSDIITAQRLGILAVDNAMAGYTDVMISQWLTEYVLVPLKLVVLGRKRIPKEGIFWKSVIAKTGQPLNLK